jgi:hypothetical protein
VAARRRERGRSRTDRRARSSPVPSVIRVDDEPRAAGNHEFAADIRNVGAPSVIGLTLVWLRSGESAPEPSVGAGRFFETGDRQRLAIRTHVPDVHRPYDLRLWVSGVRVEIENDGSDGRLDVRLLDRGRPVDRVTATVRADETLSVMFDGRYPVTEPADIGVDVRPA